MGSTPYAPAAHYLSLVSALVARSQLCLGHQEAQYRRNPAPRVLHPAPPRVYAYHFLCDSRCTVQSPRPRQCRLATIGVGRIIEQVRCICDSTSGKTLPTPNPLCGFPVAVAPGPSTTPRGPICSRGLPSNYHGHRRWNNLHKGMRHILVAADEVGTNLCSEPGLLCTHARESTRQRAPIAPTSVQPWTDGRRLSLLAHGPRQPALSLLLERLGSSTVSAIADLHVSSGQARKAHADTPPSVLPPLAL